MRRAACVLAAVVCLAAPAAQARQPVVVELYTSQGCSACLPANPLIAELGERDGVLPLTFPVDYWDYLGWPDTFARPEFSERQRGYMQALGLREVYTPQIVVDGRTAQAARGEPAAVDDLLRQAASRHDAAPDMRFMPDGRAAVGSGRTPRGGADVWLVRYAEEPQEVAVRDGENRGRTVHYHNVVRELRPLGTWSGARKAYDLPPSADDGLKTLVLLQARSGPILGVLAQ